MSVEGHICNWQYPGVVIQNGGYLTKFYVLKISSLRELWIWPGFCQYKTDDLSRQNQSFVDAT